MFSDELDLGDDLRTSGPQLGAELLERIAPSNPLEYVQENLLGRNGEGAKIAEAVARAGGPKKTSVQRTLERYATGERAKGGLGPKQAKTLEAYQQKYELATGKRSEVLQTLIDVASGKRVTGQLPKGTLTIQIMAAIDAYAGSHDPRANTPRPVTLDIPPRAHGPRVRRPDGRMGAGFRGNATGHHHQPGGLDRNDVHPERLRPCESIRC